MIEKTEVEREYYYIINDMNVPDDEYMVAFLLDEGVLFVGNSSKAGSVTLYVLINDYFVPGSDAESLPPKDISKLYELYKEKSWDGVRQYVADKRGIPNKHWRTKNETDTDTISS